MPLHELVIAGGFIVLYVGLLIGFLDGRSQVVCGIGIAVIVLGFVALAPWDESAAPHVPPAPAPTPNPNPGPQPGPTPQPQPGPAPGPVPTPTPTPLPPGPTPTPKPPLTTYQQGIAASFAAAGGTAQDAAKLAGMFTQMGEIIRGDNGTLLPTTKSVSDFFAAMQRLRDMQQSPWGDRYGAMEDLFVAEARTRGVIRDGPPVQLDAATRATCAQLFLDTGAALASLAR